MCTQGSKIKCKSLPYISSYFINPSIVSDFLFHTHQLDYHKQQLSARVRLLLARARTQFLQQHISPTKSCVTTPPPPSRHCFRAEMFFFHRICSLGESVRHIFIAIMQYFNPLHNLTFIWRNPRITPALRSGGLCTSIIRRTTKRNATHLTLSTNAGQAKRARLRPKQINQNKRRPSCVRTKLNKRHSRWHFQQPEKENSIDLLMDRLAAVKTNIVWEFLCRRCA